jgi:hypothetical protein
VGALSPLLLNIILEYAIMNFQVNQQELEMTYHIPINGDNIIFWGRNIR